MYNPLDGGGNASPLMDAFNVRLVLRVDWRPVLPTPQARAWVRKSGWLIA